MIRPPSLAPGISLEAGRKDPPCSMVVKLLSPRSAEPPHNSGKALAIALIVSPDALRVATEVPGSNLGSTSCQFAGNSRAWSRSNSFADSGFFAAQAEYSLDHCARASLPLVATCLACARTSSEISKVLSGSRPSNSLVAATSASPSAAP